MLLNKNKSVSSVNKNGFVGLEIIQSTKPIINTNIQDKIDEMEVFQTEASNCNNYRLIFNVKPYCTNVLFNTITEIVKNDGTDNASVVTDNARSEYMDPENVYGLYENLERKYMIENSEYTKDNIGYIYYPGYDIFNNHILRNLSFKSVCKPFKNDDSGVNINARRLFNTINDYMRFENTETVKLRRRNSITDDLNVDPRTSSKHLYNMEDIMSYVNGDAINNNLIEKNGWFGFINGSNMNIKYKKQDFIGEKHDIIENLNINKLFNNRDGNDFIDMYPDRTLYTFNPKLNKFRNRFENNWELCLTYPYKNFYDSDLINGDGINGIKVMEIYKNKSQIGSDVLYFRTYCKHGFKPNDTFNLYIGNTLLRNNIIVMNVGNQLRNENEYYFYISDISLLNDMLNFTENGENVIWNDFSDDSKINDTDNIRIVRTVNNIESKYYFKILKKLPNFKFSKEIYNGEDNFNEYSDRNSKDNNGKMYPFTKEQYKLAFSSTIYDDSITQYTFTDDINIDNILDNNGKPINTIYATIIKTNRGHNEWYNYEHIGDGKTTYYNNSNVEYSHCFSELTSGIELSYDADDIKNFDIVSRKAKLGDLHYLNNIKTPISNVNLFDSMAIGNDITENGTFTYNKNYIIGSYIGDESNIINNKEWCYSEYINIHGHVIIDNGYIDIERINTNIIAYAEIYGSKKNFIRRIELSRNPITIDINENESFLRFSFFKYNIDYVNVKLNNDIIWKPKFKLLKDCFIGDLIEYNAYESKEKTLNYIYNRFNTQQRELSNHFNNEDGDEELDALCKLKSNRKYDDFMIKEIVSDDYYFNGFKTEETNLCDLEQNSYELYKYILSVTIRPEGYIYKPHYPIKLKELSTIKQDSHPIIRVKKATPKQINGIFINLHTALEHKCELGDEIYIVMDNEWFLTHVVYISNKLNIVIDKIKDEKYGYNDWVTLCNKINNNEILIYKRNKNIPSYAENVGKNMFIWRDVLNPIYGNNIDYSFTNNSFYITSDINFYLKRQDSDNNFGIQAIYAFPNDVDGNIKRDSRYIYKEEKDILC